MSLSVTILVNEGDFQHLLEEEIIERTQLALPFIAEQIVPWAERKLKALLRADPTYQSLISGTLRAELGIEYPSDVEAIINDIGRRIVAVPYRARGNELGGVSVEFLTGGIEELVASPYAKYVSPPSGQEIPWLKWLLTAGNSVVVANWKVFRGKRQFKRSRTGQTLMKEKTGESYSIPPEFAGTEATADNWVTKAIYELSGKPLGDEFDRILKRIIG